VRFSFFTAFCVAEGALTRRPEGDAGHHVVVLGEKVKVHLFAGAK
jgi:hypothetical protein